MEHIDYSSANLKDLINELLKTKKELVIRLEQLNNIYINTKEKTKGDEEAEILLRSYEDDDLNVTLSDAVNIIKIIENLLNDRIVRESHIKQLKNIAENNTRRKRLGDFKEDWLDRVEKEHKQDYRDLYTNFCNMEDWIDDCRNIAFGLNDYINEENPLFKEKKEQKNKHIIEIKNGSHIYINNTFSEVKLTPKISNLLKKLIVLDKNGNYPLVKTKGLENKKKRNNDTLRTTLARLRKDTEELFEIKNVKNENDESCYTIIFKD